MTAPPFVQVEHLGRIFDVSKPWLTRMTEGLPRRFLPAVADVSFTIARHETFALVGESGSGKSTVAKMTVGLVAPTSGEVVIDGISMTDPKQEAERRRLRRRIQIVFQDPYASLNPRWRALGIIAEPLRAFASLASEASGQRGHSIVRAHSAAEDARERADDTRPEPGSSARVLRSARPDITAEVDELLRLVGLDPADGAKYPHEFSGGQRQRIAIARALATRPDFIVCDEPTSALDVSVQAQILNLMRDLQDRFGLTYLFISHNLAIVRHMANRIGVMYLGRIVEVAPAKELFHAARHPYTRMLLDAVPDLDASGRPRQPVEGEVPNPIDPPPGCAFHPRCRHANARCRAEQPRLTGTASAMVACHAVAEGRI